MAKKGQVEEVKVEEETAAATPTVSSPMDDNRRASELLKQARQTMSVEALQGKITTLQNALRRAKNGM